MDTACLDVKTASMGLSLSLTKASEIPLKILCISKIQNWMVIIIAAVQHFI